ncbi:hypothetical protein NL676_036679 [Syzygium grande]|nr:hypothetical protein NL676_036679 [Syzygium grande]
MKYDEKKRSGGGGGGGGIVEVNPKPKKGVASKVVDYIKKLIVKLMYDSSRPHHYLSGNFAPVPDETPPVTDLPVLDHLPCVNRALLGFCLNGEFVRVGPNPKFAPVAGYHWFDGDGMIHGMWIKNGKATYVSHYVRTSRLKQEEYSGGSKFMKIGDLKGLFGLLMVNMQMLRAKLKIRDVSYGTGTGNTALIYQRGKLLALSEADKPYVLKVLEDGDWQTLGMLDYDERLAHSFTAHLKVDPFTENYATFMDLPLYFRPKEMVKDNKLIFPFDATKKSRFGEEDEVVLITCHLENPDLDMVNGTVKEKLENFTDELYEIRFNMKTGLASQKKLSAPVVDFPRINECYTGRKQRYVYGTILDSIPKVAGIVKFDLHSEPEEGKKKIEVGGNVEGVFDLGPGRFGSEAIFVPREPGITPEEDDGCLIFFVHDENTGKSAVNVIDAKNMSSDPVAVVELPHRVPYGFHAFFVSEVVREIQHLRTGVIVTMEDGCVYNANYAILSVSIGALQSDLISTNLENNAQQRWKMEAIEKLDVMVYTKMFLKFPYKFWPCGPEKEFFIYAHERRGYYTFWQHMENAYPGSNILVVTLTNGESKRVENQSDEETLKEAMEVLRDMFGPNISNATDILVTRWRNNRFQRGSCSNYPAIFNHQVVQNIKAPVGRFFFTGEHTSERFNGYVHGGYLAGIDTGKALLEEMRKEKERNSQNQLFLLEPLLALTLTQTDSSVSRSVQHKSDIPKHLHL